MAGRNLLAGGPVTQATEASIQSPSGRNLLTGGEPSIPTTGGLEQWRKDAAAAELSKRGKPVKTIRQQAFEELAQETNWLEAGLISMGKGFTAIGRGLGIADPADPTEKEAMQALKTEHPVSTTVGEIAGEALPFVPLALAAPAVVPAGGAMVAAGTGIAALEGGVIAKGEGRDVLAEATKGGLIGLGAELLFPVIGRLGRKVFEKLGRAPKGGLLDVSGQPTPELQQALEEAGLTFDDLTQDATTFISQQKPTANLEQVARGTRFTQEEIPFTQGELTQVSRTKAKERALLGEGAPADTLRVLKEDQSAAIEQRLSGIFKDAPDQEEMGEIFGRVLTGQDKALYTKKIELYNAAAQNAEDLGEVPIMTDNIFNAIPSEKKLRRAFILDEKGTKKLEDGLAYFEVTTPPERTLRRVSSLDDIPSEPLTLENYDDFRTMLNTVANESPSLSHIITPIKEAVDIEAEAIGEALHRTIGKEDVVSNLRGAWETVAKRSADFDSKTLAGKIISKEGDTSLIPASEVYNRIMRKSVAPENVKQLIKTTLESKGGRNAVDKLQAVTALDLIDAGFSKKIIDGKAAFDPDAFIKRYDSIGDKKLKQIFGNNQGALKQLNNFKNTAKDLKPERTVTVKRAISSIVAERVAFLKLPFMAAIFAGVAKVVARPALIRGAAKEAITPKVEQAAIEEMTKLINRQFPGIAAAIAVATQGEDND